MRYQFIREQRGEYCLERLCQAMEVSLSGYYAWLTRPESKRNQENKQIIKEIDRQCPHSYGSPRIYQELKANGISCSENTVARLMQKNGIAAKRKRKFMVTTDSRHGLPVTENKLNQEFSTSRPNEKWVTDITYIWTKEGWLYLGVERFKRCPMKRTAGSLAVGL